MIEMPTTLLSVAVIWSIAVVTPGPNLFITLQTGIRDSQSYALLVVLGITIGTIIWGSAGFMGISIFFASAPWAYTFLKCIGGLSLIYLGIRLVVLSFRKEPRENENSHQPPRKNLMAALHLGMLTNLANPKTALFVASLFASTMPQESTLIMGISCIFVMAFVSFSWYGFMAILSSSDQVAGYFKRNLRLIDRISGTAFIGFGLNLATSR